MKEIIISDREAGQRLDKLLTKVLKEAPKSFIYKMLRKKNITLNGKKADGTEKLVRMDSVRLFFSDETLAKFMGSHPTDEYQDETIRKLLRLDTGKIGIIYEDQHVLLVNKPVGMLSQKASEDDLSLVEYITAYLLKTGSVTSEDLISFHPAVCNRLDRNTSGIVAAGKTIAGLQELGELFHDRTLKKYYRCLVKGPIHEPSYLNGYLTKDEKKNQVKISAVQTEGAQRIETSYTPILVSGSYTLLEVHLITGRSHQIRAHLASVGHPIVGDGKYGDDRINQTFRQQYGLKNQLLHAYRLEMPILTGALEPMSEKIYLADCPVKFQKIVNDIWETEN